MATPTLRGDDKPTYRHAAASMQTRRYHGGGNAFNGALAASLATRARSAFIDHTRFANRFAALSTERAGARAAMPRREDVVARFAD